MQEAAAGVVLVLVADVAHLLGLMVVVAALLELVAASVAAAAWLGTGRRWSRAEEEMGKRKLMCGIRWASWAASWTGRSGKRTEALPAAGGQGSRMWSTEASYPGCWEYPGQDWASCGWSVMHCT